MTISKTFSAAGVSEPLYVRSGEDFDYTTVAAGGFVETADLESSVNGGTTWTVLVSGIASTIASTRVRNYNSKPALYRFRCTQVGGGFTGTLAITLADVAEDVQTFQNKAGVTVGAVTESGLRVDGLQVVSTDVTAALSGLTATADELNKNDVSLQAETVVKSGVASVTKLNTKINSTTGAGAITLAAPDSSVYGMVKTIEMTVDGGDITLALTEVVGGTAVTTATFSAVGQVLVLLASTSKWIVLKEYGVVLS